MTNKSPKRDSFIFYRSFYEAIQNFPKKSHGRLYESIIKYIFNDEKIELDGLEKSIFILVKPQLDANNIKYTNGKKGGKYGILGGRPKKPLNNPNGVLKNNPEITPNANVNGNVNVNGNGAAVFLPLLQKDSSTKQVEVAELNKYAQVILRGFYSSKNIPPEKQSTSTVGWFDNFCYWASKYTLEQIGEALTKFTEDDWGKKQTLSVFFKTTDSNGESVDRIGDFLQK